VRVPTFNIQVRRNGTAPRLHKEFLYVHVCNGELRHMFTNSLNALFSRDFKKDKFVISEPAVMAVLWATNNGTLLHRPT